MEKDINKFFVKPEDSLKEAMKIIDLNGHGIALVVNENKKLLGLVTDGDIRRAIISGIDLNSEIKETMNKDPVRVKQKSEIIEIFDVINERKANHIPLINEEGIVKDILLKEEIIQLLKQSSLPTYQKDFVSVTENKILIIGGAGFIGSVLTKQLLDKGYSVKILDNFIYGDKSIEEFKGIAGFSYISGDIGNVDTLIEAVKDVDAVVHLAEIVGDPACAVNPQKTQQTNFISTTLISNICRYFQINRFIYASSCSVYGESKGEELLTEKSLLNPVSLYARMKIESEKAILNMCDGVFSPTILRFSTVFGDSYRMRFDLVVNLLSAKAVKDGKITVFGGDQWRPFVHVSDAANSIVTVLEAPLEKIKGEVFNVGSTKNNFTINRVGELVKEIVPSAELLIEDKDVDKRNYRVDFSKIENVLGFGVKFNVIDGIKEIVQFSKENKYGDYCSEVYSNHKTFLKN